MALLRKYIWVLVILGMIFVSLVISLIFVLIYKCIFRKGKHRILQLQERSDTKVENNKYQTRQADTSTPPLPPRTQFVTADAQIYENLGEEFECDDQIDHDYEDALEPKLDCVKVQKNPLYNHGNNNSGDSVAQIYECLAEEKNYEESVDPQLDYVKVDGEPDSFPPLPLCDSDPNMTCISSQGQSYENLADDNDYEERTDQQSDYVKVDGEDVLPHDPNHAAMENVSTASTEDYDDIGGDDEDYDDVA